jgi:hypothetical protein
LREEKEREGQRKIKERVRGKEERRIER